MAAGIGSFAFSLQSAAVLIALPHLAAFLRGVVSSEWTATIYLFSITASLLLCGRLGDTFGNRRTYLSGLILFTAGSCFCGVTSHPVLFLTSRALQGVGAALAGANSPALITRWLPGRRYGSGFGWQAALTYSGLCLGPVAAAAFISHYGWRSIFLMEVLVGIAAIVLGLRFIPVDDVSAASKSRFPALSGILWVGCLIPVLTLLTQAAHWGWTSPRVLTLLAVWGIAIACFGVCERRAQVPLVNFKLLSHPAIPLSLACELLLYFCIYMIGFFIPLMFFRGNASKATAAGLILTIEGLARLLGAAAAGRVTDRYGALPVAVAGSSLVLAGSLLFCFAAGTAQILTFGAGGFLVGLGAGVFVPANSLRLFANVLLDRHGVAAGVFATARNLGMMTGMACAAGLALMFSRGSDSLIVAIRIGFSVMSLIAASIVIAHIIVGLKASHRLRDQRLRASTLSQSAFTR